MTDALYRQQFLLEHPFQDISNRTLFPSLAVSLHRTSTPYFSLAASKPIDLEDHLSAPFLPLSIYVKSCKEELARLEEVDERRPKVDFDSLSKEVIAMYATAFGFPSV